MSLDTPILFCTFNRPDLTGRVFRRIASMQPRVLLVSSDGPRPDQPDESQLVQACRDVIGQVNWKCDVRRLFSHSNQGCRRQMADAISWGFEQFERLIILEDDCLPGRSFFSFCDELLQRYADDDRIMAISGNNFQPTRATAFSYYFSKYFHIWGWASWRRAWQHFDLEMKSWPAEKSAGLIEQWTSDPQENEYWTQVFDRQYSEPIDTWDYSWAFACWQQGGWSVLPSVNLVQNIGFDERATHTTRFNHPLANRPTFSLDQLKHPPVVARDIERDQYSWRNVFCPPAPRPSRRLRNPFSRRAA